MGAPRDGCTAPQRRGADRARPHGRPAGDGIPGRDRRGHGDHLGLGAGTVGDDCRPDWRLEEGSAQRRRWRAAARHSACCWWRRWRSRLLWPPACSGGRSSRLTNALLGFDDDRLLVATVRTPSAPLAAQSEVRHRLARGRVGTRDRRGRRLGPGAGPLCLSGPFPRLIRCPAAAGPGNPDAPGPDHTWVVRGVQHAGARGTRHRRTRRGRRPTGDGRQRSVRGTVLSRSEPGGTDARDDVRVPGGEFTFDPKAVVGIVGNACTSPSAGPSVPSSTCP